MSSAYFKQQKRGKERELKSYQKRRNQLVTIENSFHRSFEDYASDITAKSREAKDCMAYGVQIDGRRIVPEMFYEWDAGMGDADLYQSKQSVSAEIQAVDQKIQELGAQIGRLQQQAMDEERKEKAEADAKRAALFS